MKVLLVNGSPHKDGATNLALEEVSKALNKNGIDTEIFWIGNKAIAGCIGCGVCYKNQRCFINDKVNEFLEKAEKADGYIFGSAVHYAGPTGFMKSFMDRCFYDKNCFDYKPAACVVSARRGGAATAFDDLNKYFTIKNMIVVGSQYWNQIHGNNKEEAVKDEEGLQTMRTLGNNMSWILKCIEVGKKNGIQYPEKEKRISTNFIR